MEEPGGPREGCAAQSSFFAMEFAARRRYSATMKFVSMLLLALVFAGCSTSAPQPPRAIPAAEKLPDKRVTVDPALNGVIRVKEVRDMPAAQGYLKFQVDVENSGASAKTIIYNVDWLDKDGVSLGIVMDAPPCTLFAHETVPLSMTAPVPTARDFHLTFLPRVK
jgi:uncharacterized protein YcfL